MTVTPTPAAPSLIAGEDTGAFDSDGVINNPGPLLVGQTLPGATITLYDNNIATTVSNPTADANGFYAIFPWPVLDDGKHTLTITSTAPGDSPSQYSPPLYIVVDSVAPDAPVAPVLAAGLDTGASAEDGITDKNVLQLTGTAEPGSTVTLYNDGKDAPLATATAGADGTYTINTAALADGDYMFTVKATDLAGNIGMPSAATSITIDTKAPATPATPMLAPGSDTGVSHTDGLTNDPAPIVTGTTEANATVQLFDNGLMVGTGQADSNGSYAITATTLGEGAQALTVKAIDAAGNVSAGSIPLNIVVDTTPATATITAADALEEAGSVTFTVTFSTVIAALTASDFKLVSTGSANGSVQSVSGSGGIFTVTVSGLSGEGTVGLAFASTAPTDLAGNPVTVSDTVSHTVSDTTTPSTVLVSASATGVAGTGVFGSASASGRVVAFNSVTGDLVPSGATDGTDNVFVKDTLTGAITLVSTGGAGHPANGDSFGASLSADGTRLAFASEATNLVQGGTAAGETNIYVATLTEGAGGPTVTDVQLVSDGNGQAGEGVNADGTQADNAPILSSDGSTVVFDSTLSLVAGAESGVENVYAENIASGVTTLVSGGTGQNEYAYVQTLDPSSGEDYAKATPEPNKKPGGGGDFDSDVTSVSANGQLIGYESYATDLGGRSIDPTTITALPSRGYVYNVATGATTAIDGTTLIRPTATFDSADLNTFAPVLSGDGSTVFFAVHYVSGVTQVQALYKETLATGVITPVTAPNAADNYETYITDVSASRGGGLVLTTENPGLYSDQDAYQIVLDNPATGTVTQLPDGFEPELTTAGDAYTFVEAANGDASAELYETNFGISAGIDVIGTNDALGAGALAKAAAAGGLTVSGTTNAPAGATVILQFFGAEESNTAVRSQVFAGTADGAGHWSALVPVTVLQGGDGNYALVLQIGTPAGSSFFSVRDFVVDTEAPAQPDAPKLDAGSDTGMAHDGSATNQDTPTLTGTAEAGATITLYDTSSATPDTPIGTATADIDGLYTVTVAALINGKHTLDVTATDAAGNVSATSDGVTFSVDTLVPAAPAAHLDPDSDTGSSKTDGITSNATPNIVGLAAKVEAGTTVTLYDTDGVSMQGTATVATDGTFTIAASGLSDGVHMLTVTDTDAAGNVSPASVPIVVTVDTLPPFQPTIASVTGPLVGGKVTPLVMVSGTAEPNSKVTLQLNGGDTVLGETTAASDGDYSIESDPLPAGDGQVLAVIAHDAAGNASQASLPVDINVTDSAIAPPGTPPNTPTLLALLTDGPIADALVFEDANGNGVQDAGEAIAVSGADGTFTLYGGSGELVAIGGVDSTTGLPITLTLTAPAGSTVISPLTTLLDAYAALTGADPRSIQPQFLAALGLPATIDLTTLDPNAALLAGNGLPAVLGAKVMDTLTDFQAYLAGNGITEANGFAAGFTAIAKAIVRLAPGQVLDLDGGSSLETIFVDAAGAAAGPLNTPIGGNSSAVTTVAAFGNEALTADFTTGGYRLAPSIVATEMVYQGQAAAALRGVGTSAAIGAEVINLYDTSEPLSAALANDANLIDGPPTLATDTGRSDADDVIDTETPTFVGTAMPGTEVALFATYNSGSANGGPYFVTVIGVDTADATGYYSITTVPLDGNQVGSSGTNAISYQIGAVGSAPTQGITFTVGESVYIPGTTPLVEITLDPVTPPQPTITDATVTAAPGDDAGHAALYVFGSIPYLDETSDDEGAVITIYADGNPVPVAASSTALDFNNPANTADQAFFGLTTKPLADGSHVLTVTETLPGGTVVQGTASYTVTVTSPVIGSGLASATGILAGARVYNSVETTKTFANGSGQIVNMLLPTFILSAEPVDTVEATTDGAGAYQLTAPPAHSSDLLAATGGWDTLTGIPLGGAFSQSGGVYVDQDINFNAGSLLAPVGSTAISPLTSVEALLIQMKGSVAAAAAATLAGFGLSSGLNLGTLDPIAAARAGNTRPFLIDAELLDTVTMLAPFIGFSFADIAYYVGTTGTLNLTSASSVAAMLTAYYSRNPNNLPRTSYLPLATIIADSNQAIESHAAAAVSLADIFSYTLAAETVAQESATASFQAAVVAAGTSGPTITAATAAFTGANLTTAIAASRSASAQSTGFIAAGPLTTSASHVDFTISFGVAVTGLTTADFAVVTGGDLAGVHVTGVTAVAESGGSVYDVAVATGVGTGSLAVSFDPVTPLLNADGTPLTNALLEPGVTVIDAGGMPVGVTVGDLNGDGSPDAVLVSNAESTSQFTVLINQGDGSFVASAPILSSPGYDEAVAIGDFNGDGTADLLALDEADISSGGQVQVAFLAGNGDGTFAAPVTTATGISANRNQSNNTATGDLAVGDFNHDGRLDIAIAGNGSSTSYYGSSGGDTVEILLGNGDGTFHAGQALDSQTDGYENDNSTYVTTADLNGDGNLDIVSVDTAQAAIDVYLGQGDGTFHNAPSLILPNNDDPVAVAVGDLNGDGFADIVVLNSGGGGSFTVFLGKGDGTFTALAPVVVPPAHSLALADMNGDGRLDLVLNGDSLTEVLDGNGDGTFTLAASTTDGGTGGLIAVADVNGDGRPDVLVPGAYDAQADEEGTQIGLTVLLGSPETVLGSTSQAITVDRPAVAAPVLTKAGGAGTLVQTGNAYTLDLGTVAQGSTASVALALGNTAAAPADSFDGLFFVPTSGGFTVTGATLSAAIAAGGSYAGLSVAADTSTIGSYSETITFTPRDVTDDPAVVDTLSADASASDEGTTTMAPADVGGDDVALELTPITLTITDQVASGGTIATAPPVATLESPAAVAFQNTRVGTAESQAVSIANTGPVGGNALSVTTSTSGNALATGSVVALAAGAVDTSSIRVGLDTSSAGARTGAVTLQPNSGTPLSIAVSGSVYRAAAAAVTPIAAFLHVGDTGLLSLGIANIDPADGFSENLRATLTSVSGPFGATAGKSTGAIAAGASSSALTFSVSTAIAAQLTGSAVVGLISDGGGVDGLGTLSLPSQTAPLSVTVDNYANAALQLAAGTGVLTASGTNYTLNLGTVTQGSTPLTASLDVANAATGPSDALAGHFALSSANAIGLTGFADFAGLAAGQSDAGLAVSLDTSGAGTFTRTVTLTSAGSNAGGYSGALTPETLTITGTVAATATATATASQPGTSTPAASTPVYRFFDTIYGTNLFTASLSEAQTILANRPDLTEETNNFGAVLPQTDPNATAIYRFFEASNGTHFLTTSYQEYLGLTTAGTSTYRPDLAYESGSTFYEDSVQQAGDVAVYRFFDTIHGTQFLTGSQSEYAGLTTAGSSTYRPDLKPEGTAFYAPAGNYST